MQETHNEKLSAGLQSNRREARVAVRVLLVDNHPEDLHSLQESLDNTRRISAELAQVPGVGAAVRTLAGGQFDLVLLDLSLPDVLDLEALQTLARCASEVAIIGLVAAPDENQTAHALEAGAQDCLIKAQVSSDLIERSILYALECKRAEAALDAAERLYDQKEQQYRRIFQSTGDGLVINTMDGRAVEVNPAFCAMHGYAREELIGIDLNDLHPPESHPELQRYMATISAGHMFQTQGLHLHLQKDGTPFYVEVRGTSFTYDNQPHMLGVVRDVTERVRAYELLEQRVEERTRELTTLLDVATNITSTLELQPLLRRILDQLRRVADYTGASISALTAGRLTFLEARGPVPDTLGMAWSIPVNRLGAIWDTLLQGAPVIIADVRAESPLAGDFRRSVGEYPAAFGYIRSWLGVPLALKNQVIGMLALSSDQPNYYEIRHAQLAAAIAGQATVAIENARLYEEVQRTLRNTTALAQTASRVAFGGALPATLEDVCRHIVTATGAVAASVVLFGPESRELAEARLAGTYGLPDAYVAAVNKRLAAGAPLESMESIDALLRRELSIMPRLHRRFHDLAENDPELEPVLRFVRAHPFETSVAAPMVYGNHLVGGLVAYYPPGRAIDDMLLAFQTAIADQTAVAVENARLLAEVQQKAHLEERQHLARELHDSVTQELFSIGLNVRTIEVLLAQEGVRTPRLLEKMADVRRLTKGALAEMRALIFELRPGALEEEGLVEALRKHAAAVQGRESLKVEVVAGPLEVPRLQPVAEEALYRITQEAVHNVVKHARASHVEVVIKAEDHQLALCVTDDGRGFEVTAVPAGHMGLGSMRQRVAALHGEYTVESAPGAGTSVTVRLPLADWRLPVAAPAG